MYIYMYMYIHVQVCTSLVSLLCSEVVFDLFHFLGAPVICALIVGLYFPAVVVNDFDCTL